MAVAFDHETMLALIGGRRVAVICTPAAWMPGIGSLTDWLPSHADVRGFLALEHGLRGELQAGVRFDDYTDPRTGGAVFSFYGAQRTFPEHFLHGIDVVLFHVQDISRRAYTYKLALADTLAVAARTGTHVIVLDRPSPLAHLGCAGSEALQFFPLPLPMQYSTTLGELASWLRAKTSLDVDLTVLPLADWHRAMTWAETALPWIPPSPNIPTIESAYAFACTGIIEATNASEGRGTCKPFETIGAPFFDGYGLASALNRRGLPGIIFRETYFQPTFGKHNGQVCSGLHLMFSDLKRLDPVRTSLSILQELARRHPDHFRLLAGFPAWLDGAAWDTDMLRTLDIDAWCSQADIQAAAFMADIADHLLYPPARNA